MPHRVLHFRCEVGEPEMRIFKGEDHVVIPVIALVEGVLHAINSPRPEFISEAEMAKTAIAWNGQPVVVDHPEVRGEKVSANSPEVLEAEQIGQVFNASVNDKKLRMEAWINLEGVPNKEERIAETIKALKSGDMVEVSTGFFADTRDETGEFDGKKFEGTLHNIVPDHLAILSSSKGACSIEGGCGANRVNAEHEEDCECGTTPCSCEHDDKDDQKKRELQVAAEAMATLVFRAEKELSDEDRRHALQAALDIVLGPDAFGFVVSVFSETVVYMTAGGLFQRAFKIAENGSVHLDEDVVSVRPETEFVPVRTNEENDDMPTEELVKGLIANEATQYTEDDREWLMSLGADQLTRMAPVLAEEQEQEPTPSTESDADDAGSDAGSEDEDSGEQEPVTAEAYIASAPAEVQDVLNQGLRLQKENRRILVERVAKSPNNTFSPEELKAFETEQLEKLATLSAVPDYTGRGGPRTHDAEDPNAVPVPLEAFPEDTADAA